MTEAEESALYLAQWDLHEAKMKHRVLLTQTIAPLLRDAIDAIEIDVPHIALERIKHVLKLCSGE